MILCTYTSPRTFPLIIVIITLSPPSSFQLSALPLNNNLYPAASSTSTSGQPSISGRSSSRPKSTPQFSSGNRDREDMVNYSASTTGVPASSSTKTGKLFRVIYPYKPQQSDELQLTVGDILTVTMQCDDGWFVGHSTLSGSYGTFPGNYVQPIT